jgi:hypothetical protein
MSKYNGHKNWNHWNVSLWINNDEALYNRAVFFVRRYRGSRDVAAGLFWESVGGKGTKTPDGAPYSKSAIRAAMVGM